MSTNLEPSLSDNSLRRRLIIGSLSLAIAVSIIFIVVAYRLTSDLAESIEVKAFNKQFNWFFRELEALDSEQNKAEGVFSNVLKNRVYQNLDADFVTFELSSNNHSLHIRDSLDTTEITNVIRNLGFPLHADGATEINEVHFFWQYQRNSAGTFSLFIVRKISSLDEALDYVANRLSITAFLTFWLAIWAALVMSAVITKRFEANNQKLAYLAMHDPLTGLKNRTYLAEYFATQVEHQLIIQRGAILMINLNNFKDVNDAFGHSTGDELLSELASRLKVTILDKHLLVRFGSDAFVIWLNTADPQLIMPIVSEILGCCGRELQIANKQFEVGASIGIACYPDDGTELDTLLKHADIAMFQAKKFRIGAEFYQKQLPEFSERQVLLRGQLSRAVELKQFVLVYQPKVSLPDGKLIGAEALARWQHPDDGLLSPDAFIELIEQGGIIHSFSRLVISEAVRQVSVWLATGKTIPVSINLSVYNLADIDLVPFIKGQLEHFKVPAHLLEVELTESATMVDITVTKKAFADLRNLGVKLSIDDFGTGMSSFAYLRELDVDFVKIDRSFVASMMDAKRNELVVQGLISMCHSMEKIVIAEGIETEQQAHKLFELGCGIAQGYYFAKPCFAEDMQQYMA
jgi:diguanylate cyclase (GGDEF)-like protein